MSSSNPIWCQQSLNSRRVGSLLDAWTHSQRLSVQPLGALSLPTDSSHLFVRALSLPTDPSHLFVRAVSLPSDSSHLFVRGNCHHVGVEGHLAGKTRNSGTLRKSTNGIRSRYNSSSWSNGGAKIQWGFLTPSGHWY